MDDDYATDQTHAKAFYEALRFQGRPVAAYKEVPPSKHLDHWDGLSLVVLDWNLSEPEGRIEDVHIPDMAADAQRGELIDFLVSLLERYFCPVFIVSADEPNQIEKVLRAVEGFPVDSLGRRVRILQKDDDDLLPKLELLVAKDPILSTFRVWEQQYQAAKNRMFIDLDVLGTDWLVYILEAAREDGTDPGYDIVNSLFGNLQHRVDPVAFDDALLASATLGDNSEAQRKVIHGRSVLPEKRLYRSTIMPGDFFGKWRKSDPDGAIWMNITPACYTIRGRTRAEVRLHLIRGLPENVLDTQKPGGLRSKRNKETRSATIDVLHDGKAYKFDFGTLKTFSWSTVSKYRLGRLLTPYVTYVQQRHAIYLISEGLPAVLPGMYKVGQTPASPIVDVPTVM
ncbi:hypothetical protein [Herbiconiux liangxiaofengii]|uniref:hypothetical protein n=1 Tax=Herbiconiux liangxiaofengii TaxID=3342795 RepID=UPI0035B74F09